MESMENENKKDFENDEIIPIEQNNVETASNDDDNEISFEDLGLDETTLKAIEKKGFKVPSPIQALAIPRLLSGESNMIARARTGTGKTAAFGLPIIQNLRGQSGTVKALILEPTRELAIQTCNELQTFSESKLPRTCVLYGGASYTTQIKDLKKGVEIVVGTPGRIQDHIERGTLDLSKIEYFILDEGDEMLDMGFIDDIEAIFKKANPDCRILLFSATMPEPILKIAGEFMGDYEIVEEEGVIDEPLLIEQKFWILKENEKIDALVRLIDISEDFYGLVFTQTKNDADFVSKALDERGYEAAALHGDIPQSQREKILARFRIKKTRILVATDVAARGIDISGLSHVVNYSLPFDAATYVHRIGRTGRAGSQGIAVSFICPNETRKLGFLQKAVRKASKGEMKEEAIPTVEEVLEKKRARIFSELKESIGLTELQITPVTETESNNEVSENENTNEITEIQTVTNETDTEAEDILFNESALDENHVTSKLIKVSPEFDTMARNLCKYHDSQDVLAAVLSVMYASKLDKKRYGKIQSHGTSDDQTRLYVQLGRKDGYNARALADYLSKLLRIPGNLVDRIDISQTFSLVSLPKDAAKKALSIAKNNNRVPHMHVDTKESGSFGGFSGGRKRGSDRSDFGSRRKSYSHSDRNDRRNSFDGKKRPDKKTNRPNVHRQTERNGSAGLYKKKSGKAERF